MDAAALLKHEMDDAWNLVCRGMADVEETLLHWEPSPGSWGLRNRDGRWVPDYHLPHPIPPGPKTIGWLAAHLATCKEMYYEHGFGAQKKTWGDLAIPGNAEGLRRYLKQAHEPLRRLLDELKEGELDRVTRTNWGEEKPVWWIFWTMVYHDVEHGGQIWQVKNHYRATREKGTP